jgi:hypothetical protein
MRWLKVPFGAGAMAVASALPAQVAWAVDPLEYSPVCSLSDPRPCTPTVCGLSDGSRCVPYVMPPFGQDLRLTIRSRDVPPGEAPEQPVNSLRELYAALRRCWEPPARDEAHLGMQMSVRFSFKRSGEIISTPRVTYASKDTDAETQKLYRGAITAALDRCTPMPLTKGLGGALAGRPIAIRFIDDRTD